jgi:hypothetical protein
VCHFKEAFNKENATYENTKVCELKGDYFAMFYLWVFLFFFPHSCFHLYAIFVEDNVDFGIVEDGVSVVTEQGVTGHKSCDCAFCVNSKIADQG